MSTRRNGISGVIDIQVKITDGKMVRRIEIDKRIEFVAYENAPLYVNSHSNIRVWDGIHWGEIRTRTNSERIDALRLSYDPAYSAAYDDEHAANCADAYTAIVIAFPEAKNGRREDGRIVIRK